MRLRDHPAYGRISEPLSRKEQKCETGTAANSTYNSSLSLAHQIVSAVGNVLKKFGKVNTEFTMY
jgi:hypothetical protein